VSQKAKLVSTRRLYSLCRLSRSLPLALAAPLSQLSFFCLVSLYFVLTLCDSIRFYWFSALGGWELYVASFVQNVVVAAPRGVSGGGVVVQ